MKTKSSATVALMAAVGALTACAGLQPPKQEAANPAYLARIEQLSQNRCNPQVAGAVEGVGLAPGRITELYYTRDMDGTNDRVVRYTAWMRLSGQPGHLIVDADAMTCRAIQVYTRDGAKVEGVSSF
jgi:hypothetical protein